MSQQKIELLVRPMLTGAQVAACCRHFLTNIPTVRGDVNRLYAHVLKYEWESRCNLDSKNTSAYDVLNALANNQLTPFMTVKTAMDIIERENPELKSTQP